jgi:dipeptidyl aminopeptidase/acylaminoacyl peptidase
MTRNRLLPLTLATLMILPWSAGAGSDEVKRFNSTDIFALEYANDPRISPSGDQIAYERHSNDIMSDKTRSNLWIVDTDGAEHRPIVSGAIQATSPRWSSDGERIAYIVSEEEHSSIHVRWMDSGQTAEVADLQKEISSLTWSPDGRWLAFSMRVDAESEPLATPPEMPEGADWSEPVKVIDSVIYRRDGQGFVEPAYAHIFVVPSDGGTPRQLTSGKFDYEGPISWTPDSRSLLFAGNQNEDWEYQRVERDIYSVSVADSRIKRITDKQGGETKPGMSPDGRHIAYVYDDNRMLAYRNKVLRVMNSDGTGDRALTADLDRSVDDFQWARSGGSIYFQYDDRAVRKVSRVSLSGDIDAVVNGLGGTTIGRPYVSGSFSASANGIVAYTRGTQHRPADIAVVSRHGERVLTALNEDLLGNRTLGDVHGINYSSSFDGQEIQGWYVTPPGFDSGKKYPLILEIHGGPHSAYGTNFSAEVQRYAAEGYIVFYDNYRGSTSYGEDFALLLQYKYSSPEDFADHMSGIDALIGQGFVDPDNLFITGGSAGGIGSAYAIGLTDRFKAAAVAKPVINWISKTLTGDIYTYQITHQFPGMPWEELEHYWQRSPLSLVGNVVTPTMLITGEEDYRTPISETEQFYQALKMRRVESVMVRIPGSPHGIAGRPSRLIAKSDNILAWFARYRHESDKSEGE